MVWSSSQSRIPWVVVLFLHFIWPFFQPTFVSRLAIFLSVRLWRANVGFTVIHYFYKDTIRVVAAFRWTCRACLLVNWRLLFRGELFYMPFLQLRILSFQYWKVSEDPWARGELPSWIDSKHFSTDQGYLSTCIVWWSMGKYTSMTRWRMINEELPYVSPCTSISRGIMMGVLYQTSNYANITLYRCRAHGTAIRLKLFLIWTSRIVGFMW